ncbi:lipopolysaccharide biosynthesis protein [Pseudanabaena sp. Chao 1811]|uniref:lipopolysaccharide biosynthesis protein n=1 Tax=Pseudanabaena sp. Chao 1811 TaxID=2963092 RepID=UPI0022F3FC56|nr:oligosaccharide flippase family protein [Pseudanabaena sp. Chao 1811]
MSAIKKLIKGGAWLTLANVISKLASVLVIPVLARLLGAQGLGIYNIVFSLAQSAQGFSSLGVDISMQRNGAQYKTVGIESVGRLFGVGLIMNCSVSAITGLGIWLFREPLATHWLSQPSVTTWLGLAAILITLQPLGNVPLLFLSSLQDFRAYALRSSLGIVSSSILTVLLAWQMGLSGAFLGMILAAITQIIWSYLIVKPVLKSKEIRLRCDKFWKEVRSILQFGFPYYLGNTLLGSLVGLPLMGLVSQYGGLEQLGYLRVAQSISALIGFIPSAIAPAAISYLSASAADDKQSYQYLKSVHLRGVWILLLIPTGLVSLILPQLIHLLFGANYEQAIILSWISLWTSAIAGISSLLVQYLVVSGKTLKVSYASLVGVICWILFAFLLVPRYSSLGFLISQFIGQLAGFLYIIKPSLGDLAKTDILLLIKLMVISEIFFVYSLFVSVFPTTYLNNYWLVIITMPMICISTFNSVLYTAEKLRIKKILPLKR